MADLFLYRVSSRKANCLILSLKMTVFLLGIFQLFCKLFTCSDNVFP